jgi:hypothetical protein
LEKFEHKLARHKNHLVFSLRCKDEGLTPPSLRLKCPINTQNDKSIIEKAQKGLLRERIRVVNNRINRFNEEKAAAKQVLFEKLPEETQKHVDLHMASAHEKEHSKSKYRQQKKLSQLILKKGQSEPDLSGTQLKRWVVNISKYALDNNSEQILAKGLNFAPSPEIIPMNDFIVATEKATWLLPPHEADQLRCEVTGLLNTARPPKSNITKGQRKAVKTLQKEKSIYILPADKGKATVVVDKEEYDKKVLDMLSDERTYEKLNKDPTAVYKRKLVSILSQLKQEKKITESQYTQLYPTSEKIPVLYCTPKIHKQDNPLRPIVDYTGSIGYKTSRALADLLQPLVGKTKHHVNNSKDFSEEVATVLIEDGDIFISHDVVSLFTNVPIDKALDVIKERLLNDRSLKDRSNLQAGDIIKLLEFILTTTYFKFRGNIYQQKFGAAMGSPVSPIVANLFMEFLEQSAIASAPVECAPKLWKRYVDDILEIVKAGKASELTDHLNTTDVTGNIKFTCEEEEDGKIPFLDTLIVKKDDGSVKLLVYRKKTHTDQYLNFTSHHPLHQKLGVIRTLLYRKDTIVTEEADKLNEEIHIINALKNCGYPDWSVKSVKEKMTSSEIKRKDKNKTGEKSKGLVVIPYVKGLSEAIDRVFRKHGVTTAMKPHCTLRQLLVHPKDKTEKNKISECVYSVPCKTCDKVYIGETGRSVGVRLEEHKKDCNSIAGKRYTRANRLTSAIEQHKSAITDHLAQENHVIDWEGTKIIDREGHRTTRQVKEAIWIRRSKNTMNRDEGAYNLSHVYDSLVTLPPSGQTERPSV